MREHRLTEIDMKSNYVIVNHDYELLMKILKTISSILYKITKRCGSANQDHNARPRRDCGLFYYRKIRNMGFYICSNILKGKIS
jgi:hypothetical protein